MGTFVVFHFNTSLPALEDAERGLEQSLLRPRDAVVRLRLRRRYRARAFAVREAQPGERLRNEGIE